MIDIQKYSYHLPEDRIAQLPLDNRDDSRLLVYDHGQVTHRRFVELADILPPHSFLFFNDTKVIPARIIFRKETGAEIEVFLLSPIEPSPLVSLAMQSKGSCTWKCTIGNLKRWKVGTRLKMNLTDSTLTASLVDREQGVVQFTWDKDKSFAELITEIGQVPLPPYLNRRPAPSDKQRYQTVYSQHDGAVAAPTAGLHFTEQTFQALRARNIQSDFVTLHVSAGTFQPVKVQNADEHAMHSEQIIVSRSNLENILKHPFIVAVGTTSMRTLESIYWYGLKLLNGQEADFRIRQDDPYREYALQPTLEEAIETVIQHMTKKDVDSLQGDTSIFIKPGYKFRVCKGLITNFHQPGSTLILLVAAFVGDDWQKIYKEAIENNYRFLSYGDSSLLIPGSTLESSSSQQS